MRRKEVTKELIQLSKQAKELGFPQDVEYADWYIRKDKYFKNGYSHPLLWVWNEQKPKPELQEKIFLILSFSRCLEWIRDYDEESFVHGRFAIDVDGISLLIDVEGYGHFENEDKTHHEAMAKCVCRILEESIDD